MTNELKTKVAEGMNRAAQKAPYDIRTHTPMAFYGLLTQAAIDIMQKEVIDDLVEALEGMAYYSIRCESWQDNEGRKYVQRVEQALANLKQKMGA